MIFIVLILNLFILIVPVMMANILCICPHRALSHFLAFSSYFQELSNNGHNLTIISQYSLNNPNISEISLKGTVDNMINKKTIPDQIPHALIMNIDLIKKFSEGRKINEVLFNTSSMKELFIDNSTQYDLLITEHFSNELGLIFAKKKNIPFILLSSCGLLPWSQSIIAQSYEMSTVPSTLESGVNKKMNLYERLLNTVIVTIQLLGYNFIIRPNDEDFIRKTFAMDISLEKIANNVSLILVNTHHSIHGVKPLVPAVIEVGGLHIKPPNELPMDIRKFIDEAEHGIIYFCMGSLLRGETFPAHKRQMFLNVFSKLKQKVLWKWEGDMPGITSNVMIKKWMPQRDILAHPNVKLFISHGGLLGTTEAVYEGVPILAMPIFGDQMTNIKAVMDTGGAEMLNYNNLEEDEIFNKIKAMLTNPIYKNKANKLSEIFRDRPMSPLESAVYWTEYVIKHKGAPHLRTAAVGMPWFQYYLIDVFLVIIIIIVTLCFVIYFTLSKLQNLLKSSIK
ncbi:UDP-glycosyltransferase UGT5-like isoform X3 [Daktulosphaira vitifoliae]|uniref:UDP-glycosyltransferase UGT5-like isoform X3 n=1 Tax=Daktulosphaira vitifoliae TaxID=58002 RepID=UPI0021AA5278|nr:UDP-glycosyltransferase UGT5-like isoform X3 [Daktulosphaira vitifoliae]